MPGSVRENDEFVTRIVTRKIKPARVLDVGAGQGTYSNLLRPVLPDAQFEALEIWEPYVEQFGLNWLYDVVHIADAREWEDFDYDLVIYGDVLEHMALAEAKSVWARTAEVAKWAMISVPIIHYPQGASHGNPHEEHVQDHLTPQFIRRHFGPFEDSAIYEVTGTFFRRFR